MSLSGDLVEDDDYVTKLLVEDGRRSSMRYASQGLSALLPKRPPGSAPKPNTRFLKTLVREADSHNAKLKEKEELEARIRLKRIRDAEQSSKGLGRGRENEGRHDRERKRRRLSDDKGSRTDERERGRDSRRSRSPEHKRRRRRRHETDEPDEGSNHRRTRHRISSHRPRSRSRSRSRSRERKEKERNIKDRQKQGHERKSRRHSPPTDPEPEGQKGVKHGTRTPSISSTSTTDDPLSYLIGPRPTPPDDQCPQRRGRGFHHRSLHQSRSNIDAHFSPTYDPSTHDAGLVDSDDLNPEDGEGDQDEWTSALSALRDRRAWRAKQAERMKDAGFSEEEIKRWEKSASSRTLLAGSGDGGEEGDARDVKWRKKGEEREWDVGKERNPSPSPSDHGVVDKAHKTAREADGAKTEKKKKARGAGAGAGADSAWRRPQNAFLKQFKSALR
ncbi:uncharacterized protein A1O5_06694 [Cladophialophora psammophila CBS 110553]|uniref:Uncharacterized protein n=1 Tax=Cladophialophora psammophila CBS 110553 TaxID=1182543 RepID=W9WRR1_9EURO|nr:uncharacterized protein A1O5_06694 [Cladophialophora psammophila CBS 110553]EXJ70623.1 hypothetical protein A1O5_06694 [Cladophialophora psammophila CBS 110553]